MTNSNSHVIDGAVGPSGAAQALGALQEWLAGAGLGDLHISLASQMPSQVAIQLLLAAHKELARSDRGTACLSDDARRLCALSSGQAVSVPLLPPHRSA